ncbi:MAG: hypothetical protein WAY93_06635 [Atopobiaceae bacterium]|jgi:hypothetical protein|nr:hypothetical protein [Atopobiaceae bacterium]
MDWEEFAKSLSPEQAKKFGECKSVEEVISLARAERIALPDDILSSVSGGTSRSQWGPGMGNPFYDALQTHDFGLFRGVKISEPRHELS